MNAYKGRQTLQASHTQSDIVLGHVTVWIGDCGRRQIIVLRVCIGLTRIPLHVRTVPSCELVLHGLTHRRSDIALRVVGPYLSDVQVLDKYNWVASPELLRGDETTRGHDTAGCKLCALLNASTFQND